MYILYYGKFGVFNGIPIHENMCVSAFFLLFCYCSLDDICFLRRDRNGVDLDWMEGMKELRIIGEILIRVYLWKKIYFQQMKKKKMLLFNL